MPHDPLPEVAAFQAFLTGRIWVFGDTKRTAALPAGSGPRPWKELVQTRVGVPGPGFKG
jgi:hypothetical protein